MSSLALNYVVGLLARREYSEYEIRCKMQEKAFAEDEIESAIAQCQQKNWQSDLRFAENYIRFRAQRGYGATRIKQELRQLKGVQQTIIDEALNAVEIDWQQLAQQQLSKKFPEPAKDAKTKQKIWRYMLSHGFSVDEFT